MHTLSTLYDVLLSPARAGKDRTNNLSLVAESKDQTNNQSLVAVPICYRNEGQNDQFQLCLLRYPPEIIGYDYFPPIDMFF
jgi:hypothetical protein